MANETVMVDLTPEALQNRLRRGDVYNPQKVDQALKNFFRGGNLIALRELALRQVAEHVDRSLETYMAAKDIGQLGGPREAGGVHQLEPSAQYLIARGARMARRLDAEFYVIYVDGGGRQRRSGKNRSPPIFSSPRIWERRSSHAKGETSPKPWRRSSPRNTSPRSFSGAPP
jgi:K+-sensing histidine kinase KdpD